MSARKSPALSKPSPSKLGIRKTRIRGTKNPGLKQRMEDRLAGNLALPMADLRMGNDPTKYPPSSTMY
jgi:hypothetical protein